jgi:hypothetical protein
MAGASPGMDLSQRKEQFCYAFVQAVAAVAGFAHYLMSVDDDSVDIGFARRGARGTTRAPRVEAQLKCWGQGALTRDVGFPLKRKNYDDLRAADLAVPRILIVLSVPENLAEWLHQDHDQMLVRHCARWASLRGMPPTDNQKSVTVTLLAKQLFTPDALVTLMDRIEQGGDP